jgi:quinol-cytochrome oxidoreductase complex cytochrome b subunit
MPVKTTLILLLLGTIFFWANQILPAVALFIIAVAYSFLDASGSTKGFEKTKQLIKNEIAIEKEKLSKAKPWYPGRNIKKLFKKAIDWLRFDEIK